MDGVKYKFHFDRQELHLIIPQKYIKENSDNEAPINLWDFGIPAFLMNYNITGSSWINKKSNSNDSYYATLSLDLIYTNGVSEIMGYGKKQEQKKTAIKI